MSDTLSSTFDGSARPAWQETLARVVYPVSLVSAVGTFLWASANGYPKWVSAYLPVVFCAAIVLPILERLIPHRMDWRPDWKEWNTDALYAIVIQILMPPLLALLVVLGLSELTRPYLQSVIWPHHWPILGQGILMVLLVDLMRYWVHRFAHTNPILWRLHAVHHSPDKLYWLNTARFHPLEKVLQFTFDSVPFILLGVNEYVLAFYFVCYAVNGFYQHSNVHLRLGVLNYVFSTAELHRWHHSKVLKEANNNYSNTTIIWDIVFGTYYRPSDRALGRIGIQNDNYPKTFGRQLLGPFVRNLERNEVFVPTLREWMLNLLLQLGFAKISLTHWRIFTKAARNANLTQQRVLIRILQQNRNTVFGKQHRFSEISSVAKYQRQCPIQTYDTLRPYIDEQERTGSPGVTAEAAMYYAKTSGTTGAAKLLPVTPTMLAQIRRQQALAGFLQFRACPSAFRGALLGITGPAEEERNASDKAIGAISGVMYDMLPWPMKRKFIVPPAVFGIKDHLTKYLIILRLALAEKGITYIATANPSTIVLMLELVHKHRDELLAGIETGKWPAERELPPHIADVLMPKLQGDKKRADELRELFDAKGQVAVSDIWPYVAMVATWTGGNCRIPLETLKPRLPEHAVLMDLGFLASEGRITFATETNTAAGLPVLTDYFFEFVERERWDERQPEFLALDQLEIGRNYYVFVTTSGGLYRYDMNDIVTVTRRLRSVPMLEFVQKGRGVTSITGEKLYENQVIKAVTEAAKQASLIIPFFVLLADRDAAHYEFYFEPEGADVAEYAQFAQLLDQKLGEQNEEYKQKRASERLKALQIGQLKPGAATIYRAYMVKRGQREAQFKVQCLAYKDQAGFDFRPLLAG